MGLGIFLFLQLVTFPAIPNLCQVGACNTDQCDLSCEETCRLTTPGLLGRTDRGECCVCLSHLYHQPKKDEKPIPSTPSFFKIEDPALLMLLSEGVAEHEKMHLDQCQQRPDGVCAVCCREAEAYAAEITYLASQWKNFSNKTVQTQLTEWLINLKNTYERNIDRCLQTGGQVPIPSTWCD